MKTLKVFPILLALVFLMGCVTINLPPQATSMPTVDSGVRPTVALPSATLPVITQTEPPQGLTEEVLRNSEFLSPLMGVPVKLVDGKYSGEFNGSPLNVSMEPGVEFGDLNRDGVDDAALLLAEDSGGSGVFVSLVAVYSESGKFRQAAGVLINDRPIINALDVVDGVVKFEGFIHGPNDPMVNPTQGVKQEYTILGGKLFMTHMTSTITGGGEHIIIIDSPQDGDEVSGSVRLIGSMPIGPFENNLALQVIDPRTGQLLQKGFMVDAPDMGAPATFDSEIQLPGVASGTELLVILSELSMADGSPMALSAVWVIAK